MMFSQMTFASDEQGRYYYNDNASQLNLLGVTRIYRGRVVNPYRDDTARLIQGRYYIPSEAVRRQGVVYITRLSLESVLWRFRHGLSGLKEARCALLSDLRFDATLPYEVYLDSARDLYVFITIPTPMPQDSRTYGVDSRDGIGTHHFQEADTQS
jgi:hypothetical protein